jgi:hypothetical protein
MYRLYAIPCRYCGKSKKVNEWCGCDESLEARRKSEPILRGYATVQTDSNKDALLLDVQRQARGLHE